MDDGRRTLELHPEQLRRETDPKRLGFETTQDLPAPSGMAGQDRAQEAIDFALEMRDSRYNLFVAGPAGTGRRTAVMEAVERVARQRPPARDWCYVHNFDRHDEPRAVALPPGFAYTFERDIAGYVRDCRQAVRAAFADATYDQMRETVLKELAARHNELFEELQAQALSLGFAIRMTDSGVAVIPVVPATRAPQGEAGAGAASGVDDDDTLPALQPLTREARSQLPPEEQRRLEENNEQVQALLNAMLPQLAALGQEARSRVVRLDRDVADQALEKTTSDLVARYNVSADAVEFARSLRADMVKHVETLRQDDAPSTSADRDEDGDDEPGAPPPSGEAVQLATLLRRYRVNVLMAHQPDASAPGVVEIYPSRANLLGRVEFGVRNGLPHTDHMMIKPGALHRANGGFLVLQALDVVAAHSWESLRRVLRFGLIALETGDQTGPASASLRPEPVPCDVKVILVGDRATYAALAELDPEFRELFKVRADFEMEMPRQPDAEMAYARFAGDAARSTGAPPLDGSAVARLIDEGSRWAGDQDRLSTDFGTLRDVTLEACQWARREHVAITTRDHVRKAIAFRERRGRMRADRDEQDISDGYVLIDTAGEVVGQVNGLSVIHGLDLPYGMPSRITARTSPGVAGVVNIERETEQSGPSHTKGVLILSGFLAGRFAQDFPLSLSASICFEQTYGGIDGDSASSAELYALLSSLSGVPIRQSLAVTGSVNQRGEIQAVGAVTTKVEAFFKLCQARGLTGEQGVLIPRANVRNLMLRDEVIAAVRDGQFHVFAVSTVDEGMVILTGIPGGHPGPDGRYLEGTINARVLQTLRSYGERVRAFAPAYSARQPM